MPVRISGGLSHVGYNQNCCLIDLLVLHPSLLVFFFLNFSCETLIRTLLFLGLQLQYSRTGKGRPVMLFFYFRKAGKNLLKPNSFLKKILKPMGIRPSIDKNYSMVLNFNPYPICFLPYASRKELFFFFTEYLEKTRSFRPFCGFIIVIVSYPICLIFFILLILIRSYYLFYLSIL